MAISADQFVDNLRRSNLLTAEDIEYVRRIAARESRARDVAIEVVRNELLTRWQAEQLLFGRTAFRLGDYVLRRKIGGGATGSVYDAVHAATDSRRALKVLAPQLATDRNYVARFRREVAILQKLQHPGVVKCFGAERVNETEFLVMESIPGRDLASWIEAKGTLSPLAASRLGELVADALAHVDGHGIVHRDIKPSNLIVWTDRQSNSLQVRIVDFGTARHAADDSTNLTADNVVLGSLDFMAPEQFENAASVDIRADIFSLGATVFTMLTGETLTQGGNVAEKVAERIAKPPRSLRDVLPSCPRPLARVIDRCLSRDPADRFTSPTELAHAIRAARSQADETTVDTENPLESEAEEFVPISQSPIRVELTDDSANDLTDFLSALTTQSPDTTTSIAVSDQRRLTPAKRDIKPLSFRIGAVCGLVAVIAVLAFSWLGQATLQIEWPAEDQTKGSSLRVAQVTVPLTSDGVMSIRLPPGVHEVKFARPGFETDIRTVRVGWGSTQTITTDWTPSTELNRHRAMREMADAWDNLRSAPPNDPELRDLRGRVAEFVRSKPIHDAPGELARKLVDAIPSELSLRLPDATLSPGKESTRQREWTLFDAPFRHSGSVTDLAFSPDGKSLVTTGRDGRAFIWSADDGGLLHRFSFAAAVQQVDFSPEGNWLAMGMGDGRVELRRFRDEEEVSFSDFRAPVTALQYSPDGAMLAVGAADNKLRIYAVKAKNLLATIPFSHRVKALAWTNDSKLLAAADSNSITKLWNRSNGSTKSLQKGSPPGMLFFGADEETLVLLGGNRRRTMWSLAQQEVVPVIDGCEPTFDMAADGSWKLEVQGPFPRTFIQIREIEFTKQLQEVPVAARYCDSMNLVAVGYADGAVEVYSTDSGGLVFGPPSAEDRSTSVAISTDGSKIACGAATGRIRILDAFSRRVMEYRRANEKTERAEFQHHSNAIQFLKFCSGDRSIVSFDGNSLVITDVSDVNANQSFRATEPVCCADNGEHISYRRNDELVVYSLASNDEQMLSLTAEACHAAFSPDGRHLAVVDGTTLTILDLSRDRTSPATIPVAGPGPIVWTSHNSLYLAQPSNCCVISLGSDVVTEAIDKLEAPKIVGFAVDQAVVIDRNRFVTVNDSSYVTSIGDSETNAFEIVDAAISPNGRIALIVESNGTVRAVGF